MFGKMTIALEKSSLIGLLGLMLASCALILFKRGLMLLTTEVKTTTRLFWFKYATLLVTGLVGLLGGLVIILNSEKVLLILARRLDALSRLLDFFTA